MILSKQELRALVEKTQLVMEAMMPGVKNIAFTPIKELNETFIELAQLKRNLGA